MIQSRYGWTDETVFSLTAFRFMEIVKVIDEQMTHEYKRDLTLSAFTGWQVQELLKGVLSEKAKPQSFDSYLQNLGLVEKPKVDPEVQRIQNEMIKQQALENAKNIVNLDKKRQAQKETG